MKYVKFFVGLLLFIAPITVHTFPSGDWTINAPLGTMAYFSTFDETSFAVHSFKWYTDNGQFDYITEAFLNLHVAGMRASSFMMEDLIPNPVLTIRGIFTIITLWSVAFYVLLQIIDKKKLNLVSDIFMLGLASINLVTFFNYHNILFSPEMGIPIFSIIAGILGIVGLVFSVTDMQKKTRKRRK